MERHYVFMLQVFNLLEKKMATHSIILAWKIPWREEPGGLQSMRWQRVGHDWATNTVHAVYYIFHIPASTDFSYSSPTIFLTYFCGMNFVYLSFIWTFPCPSEGKNPSANVGDISDKSSIPGSESSHEEGNGNPPQYSCLGNPMDRGALWATVHENEEKLDTTERLNNSNNHPLGFASEAAL